MAGYGNYASRANYVNKKRYYRSYGRSVANPPKDTTNNKPVKKAYKKTAPKTKANMNKGAIMTLARQVKQLQNQRFGELQSHTQYALLTGENLPQSNRPVALCLNNFFDQKTKRGTNVGGVAAYLDGTQLVRNPYQNDINDEHEWNARRNQDLVSNTEYKPVYTRLVFSFDAVFAGATFTNAVRITIFKQKSVVMNTTKLAINCPMNLGAYRFLAERPTSFTRNYFDKKYHQVLYDKWINFSPKNVTAGETSNMRKKCTISWKYKDQILKPDIIGSPAGQEFFTNVPVEDQIWCIVSVGSEMNANLFTMEISKFDVWRDAHGDGS